MERSCFPRGIKIFCPNEPVKANAHHNGATGGHDYMMKQSRHSERSVEENEAKALCITLMHVYIVRYLAKLALCFWKRAAGVFVGLSPILRREKPVGLSREKLCHIPVDEAPQVYRLRNSVLFALFC